MASERMRAVYPEVSLARGTSDADAGGRGGADVNRRDCCARRLIIRMALRLAWLG